MAEFVHKASNRIFISLVFLAWTAMALISSAWAFYSNIGLLKLLPIWQLFAVVIFALIILGLVFYSLPKINRILVQAPDRQFWVSIILFSLTARLAIFMIMPGPVAGYGDTYIYNELAKSLVNNGTLAITFDWYGVPFYAFFPPGYALLLSIPYYLFGEISYGAFLINATAFLFLLFGVYRLAIAFFSYSVGRWAVVLIALNPTLLMLASLAAKEPLIASVCVWIAIAWLELLRCAASQSRWALLGGGLFGYLCLLQPSFAPYFILIAGTLILRRRTQALRPLLLATCCAGLILGAWSWRNYQQFNTFVPLTTATGYGIWMGPNPMWGVPPERFQNLPELEMNARYIADTIDQLKSNPSEFILVRIKAPIYLWGKEDFPAGLLATAKGWDMKGNKTNSIWLVLQIYYMAVVGGAAYFVYLYLWRLAQGVNPYTNPTNPLIIGLLTCMGIVFIYLSALHSLFESTGRHHYFLLPFLSLLAAQGLVYHMGDFKSNGIIKHS